MLVGLVLAGFMLSLRYDLLGQVSRLPLYYLVGAAGGLAGLPWLVSIERERQVQLVAYPEPGRMTIWRVGRRVGLDLDGSPVHLTSEGGVARLFVNSFDPHTHTAKASWVAGNTALDWLREEATFHRLATAHADLLRDDRITRELVGVEVNRRVSVYSDQWLRLLYGSLSVDEVEEALGLTAADVPVEPEADLEVVLDE